MMEKQQLLNVLKKREAAFKKRIENDMKAVHRLKYKSRSVRMRSPLHKRVGWFTDRLQELQLVISFIEGKISIDDFIAHKNTDAVGQMATLLGDITFD